MFKSEVKIRVSNSREDIPLICEWRVKYLETETGKMTDAERSELMKYIHHYLIDRFLIDYFNIWAYVGEKIVGFISFQTYVLPPINGQYNRKVVHGNNLFVLPEYRNHGIGRMLYAEMEIQGRSMGARRFTGSTTKHGEKMLRNYFGYYEPGNRYLIKDV